MADAFPIQINTQIGAKTEAIKKAGLKSGESAPSIQEHHHHYQTTATTHAGPESVKGAIPQQHATLHHASKSNPRTWVDN